jgi:hypothetical protein
MILTVHDCSMGVGEVGLGEANLFPNPASDAVFFEVDPSTTGWAVRAFDRAGREVAATMWSGQSTQVFDVSEWTNGHYVLQFQNGDRVITRPLAVQHGLR